jgi:hypothetical protein
MIWIGVIIFVSAGIFYTRNSIFVERGIHHDLSGDLDQADSRDDLVPTPEDCMDKN